MQVLTTDFPDLIRLSALGDLRLSLVNRESSYPQIGKEEMMQPSFLHETFAELSPLQALSIFGLSERKEYGQALQVN